MSEMVGGRFVDLIAADDNTAGGSAYRETIDEMDMELNKVIEDFGRAVDVEALRLAQKSGKHSLATMIFYFQWRLVGRAEQERAEQKLLFKWLKPIEASD